MRQNEKETAARMQKRNRKVGLWRKPDDETLRERERIRAFDAELLSYGSSGLAPATARKFWGGLMVFFTTIGACVIWDKQFVGMIVLACTWAFLAPYYYISIYLGISENRKTTPLYGKIKYLPVDIRQVKIVRIGYLIRMLKGPLIISLAIQIFIALLIGSEYLLWRFLFVLIAGGVLPFLLNAAVIWLEPQ